MATLSSTGPALSAPLSFLPKDTIASLHVKVQNVEMKCFILDKSSEKYPKALNRVIEQGTRMTPKLKVLRGGLDRVEEGLDMQKGGDQGGRKLVMSLDT